MDWMKSTAVGSSVFSDDTLRAFLFGYCLYKIIDFFVYISCYVWKDLTYVISIWRIEYYG